MFFCTREAKCEVRLNTKLRKLEGPAGERVMAENFWGWSEKKFRFKVTKIMHEGGWQKMTSHQSEILHGLILKIVIIRYHILASFSSHEK